MAADWFRLSTCRHLLAIGVQQGDERSGEPIPSPIGTYIIDMS